MDKLSNAEAALMGLLSEKPKHAYEITLDIKDRSMDYWTDISFSNVYKVLAKLEKRKLLSSKTKVTKNNVTQKIYTLTQEGTEALRLKLIELASVWQPSIQPIDIALKNLILLSKQEALNCLRQYQTSLQKTLEGYKALEQYIIEHGGHLANIQLATRRMYLLEGEIKWLRKFSQDYLNDKKRIE